MYMSHSSELIEYACWTGMNTGSNLILTFTEDFIPRTNVGQYPNFNFAELVFLYTTSEPKMSLIKFLYQYEAAHIIFYNGSEINLKPLLLFRQDEETDEYDIPPTNDDNERYYIFDLDTNIPPARNDASTILKPSSEVRQKIMNLKRKYNQYRLKLSPNNELIEYPQRNESELSIRDINQPNTEILSHILERPSLCLYASIGPKFLRRDMFYHEFTRQCSQRIETSRARGEASLYTVDLETATVPTNWYAPPPAFGIELVPPFSNINAMTRAKTWVYHFQRHENERLHVVTNSVEPLIAALIAGTHCTIEFSNETKRALDTEDNAYSIDVFNLRDSIVNGRWCGRIHHDDPQIHNLLTYIVLLLIGSSSGLPMYASRGWRVVYKVWTDMLRTIKTDVWLARDNDGLIEIFEQRLLELVIKVITITHMSDDVNDPVKGFQPGALGYVQYVEQYYTRMKSKLGHVSTKAWDVEDDLNEPVDGGETKSTYNPERSTYHTEPKIEPVIDRDEERPLWKAEETNSRDDLALRFARRVRLMEEFSYPSDMEDIRSALKYRLSHCLFKHPDKIVFV